MTTKDLTKQFTIGLVQFNSAFPGENYLPLAVGMLQAFAEEQLEQPENYNFLLPLYRRMPVDEAVEPLLGVDLALFSTYPWNYRISLEVARNLKEQSPETVIAFGGPHVPDEAEPFLREHSFIDITCHGEGERIALALLENLGSKTWDGIPGISFLRDDGSFESKAKSPRVTDLNAFPSPYLEGIFTPLIDANPSEHWIVAWETNRGCPFSCTFCDWGSAIRSKVFAFDLDRLYQEIEWFAQNKIEYVYCCDANFGILPRDLDVANYIAEAKRKTGYPNAMAVHNTKNATERAYQVMKVLAGASLTKGVGLALQSTDPATLEAIKRTNISQVSYQDLQRRFTEEGIETYSELILALPGETYDSYTNGVSTVIESGQHDRIQFHILAIYPNAEMGDPEYQKKYGMVTKESKVVNRHGTLEDSEHEISETNVLVVATDAMPKDDWVRGQAFAWMTDLLYFNKALQIPLTLVHDVCSVSYRDLLEEFLVGSLDSFPVLEEIRSFFLRRAREMQSGGPELVSSKEWLNIWWPAGEYMLIKLSVENKLEKFHEEAEALLTRMVENRSLTLPEGLLHDAALLNRALFKLPFQTEDLDLDLSYNVWEVFRSRLMGDNLPLENKPTHYHINRTQETWSSWDDWYREVIWYGAKRGAYFYGSDTVELQLARHY